MTDQNVETIKKIIIAEQLGITENAKLILVKDNLSDSDKEKIKEIVLYRARYNPSDELLAYAEALREAFILINA